MATAHLSGDLTAEDVARLAEHFEPLRAEELVAFAAEQFGGRMVLTCSWQLGTSILVHMTRDGRAADAPRRDRHGPALPRDARDPRAPRRPLRPRGRDAAPAAERRRAGRGTRRPALGARSRPLLRPAQGRAARARDPRRGRLAHGHPPRPDRAARPRAEARARRPPRRRQGAAARRLERARLLALHLPERHSVQRAARPRLPVDRLHARARARPAAARTRAPVAGPAAARPSAACTSPDDGPQPPRRVTPVRGT